MITRNEKLKLPDCLKEGDDYVDQKPKGRQSDENLISKERKFLKKIKME